ncbi:MAG: YlmH/Sll1252 family protein [Angelakisella sp.]
MAELTTNKETALLLARVEDLAAQCQRSQKPVFLGFLDTAQQTLVRNKLKYTGLDFSFWGGYDDAERVFVGIFPSAKNNNEVFPIRCLEFIWRQESLSHRDFLGSFISLRLRREVIGDICAEAGRCITFCTDHAAELILSEIVKIGRVGVSVTEIPQGTAAPEKNFLPVFGTVASLRLDCIVAFLGNLSRSNASKLISSGLVALNGIAVNSCDKTITQDDKISIRGIGKFIFDGQDGVSRKDKLRLKFRKYQ